jgi:hypothetical protein
VLGIAVGRTVFLAPEAPWDAALLLHEVGHVRQFERIRGFVFLYVWESLRRGYGGNRFETEADAWAERELSSDLLHPAPFAVSSSIADGRIGTPDLPSRGV